MIHLDITQDAINDNITYLFGVHLSNIGPSEMHPDQKKNAE